MNALVPSAFAGTEADPGPHRFTVNDVRLMIEHGALHPDARVELIGGVLLDMASEGMPHLTANGALTIWLARAIDADRYGIIPDGTLHLSKTDAPEPDFYLFDQGGLREPVTPGSVHLVIEIANTSHERDLKLKPELYGAYRLPTYWVVDLPAGVTHVHTRPNGQSYGSVVQTPFAEPLRHETFGDAELRVADLPHFAPA